MTMSAVDFLDQWFETDVLKATMSASGIIGTFLGVRSPGTAYVLLHHYMGEIDGAFRSWGFARGGTGAISNAIAAAAREAGVEIRTEAPVARITREATARRPASCWRTATSCRRDLVLSSVDPNLTFLKFIDAEASCRPIFVEEVRRYKLPRLVRQGEPGARRAAELHLSCRARAAPARRDLDLAGRRLHGARLRSGEATASSRGGRTSDMVIPTLTDPSVAPPGKHILSVLRAVRAVQAGVGHLGRPARGVRRHGRSTRSPSTRRTSATSSCTGRSLTPLDLEREFGLTEGNIFQGELTLEQLFFARPVPGWAQYTTPIQNLWMCGSATHPGGGIMGAPGRNAALRILGKT